jgi:5'-3' exonuclease
MIDSTLARESLGPFTKAQWIDFALLCGTDFTETVPSHVYFCKLAVWRGLQRLIFSEFRVGAVGALRLIKEYGSIESILSANHPKYFPDAHEREQYLRDIAKARAIFSDPPPLPSDADFTMKKAAADLDGVLKGFGITRGFGGDRFLGERFGDDPRERP